MGESRGRAVVLGGRVVVCFQPGTNSSAASSLELCIGRQYPLEESELPFEGD